MSSMHTDRTSQCELPFPPCVNCGWWFLAAAAAAAVGRGLLLMVVVFTAQLAVAHPGLWQTQQGETCHMRSTYHDDLAMLGMMGNCAEIMYLKLCIPKYQ
jgi:hypothetical protein